MLGFACVWNDPVGLCHADLLGRVLLWAGLLTALPPLLGALAARAAASLSGRVALVGEGPALEPVCRLLATGAASPLVGRFPDDPDGHARLAAALSGSRTPDRVLLLGPAPAPARFAAMARALACLDVEIALLRDPADPAAAPPGRPGRLAGLPVVVLAERALPVWGRLVKRLFDLSVAVALLVLVAPLMGLAALAIRLDDGGPCLFRQSREGRHGARFAMLKFRTMTPSGAGGAGGEGSGLVQTSRDDRRMTRVGRFLRRTSIDELPQLINVIRGDMSLIGPRPHVPGMLADLRRAARLEDQYARRHRVRPGMSGWAQVNHSRGAIVGAAALAERLGFDLFYVEHWSPLLDLKVALLTPMRVLFHHGTAF